MRGRGLRARLRRVLGAARGGHREDLGAGGARGDRAEARDWAV